MKKSLKNILVALAILFSASFVTSALSLTPTYAADTRSDSKHTDCTKDSFLGFTPWDCGINLEEINNKDQDGTAQVGKAIWTIVANIALDLVVAATYLILGYVIYGGYLYIFNSSEPSKVTQGKKTLAQAFIGFGIVMGASIIVNTVRIALNMGSKNLQDCLNSKSGTGSENYVTVFSSDCAQQITEVQDMVTNAIQWTIAIAGVVALIFVVYGAIMYITSAGDVGKVQKAKNMLLYSCIGLAIVALAEIITGAVSSQIRAATKTSLVDNTSIALELTRKEIT